MTKHEVELLLIISSCSSLIPIIFYFVFFRRNRGRRLWVIPLYTAISFVSDAVLYINRLSPLNKYITFFVYPIFTLAEGTLFGIFLYFLLKNRLLKIFTILLFVLNLLYITISALTTADPLNSGLGLAFASAEEFSIIVLCIVYFYEVLNNPDITFIYETKEFWIITAFFFVSVATLTLFVSGSLLVTKTNYWPISMTATILKNFMLVIALFRRPALKLSR